MIIRKYKSPSSLPLDPRVSCDLAFSCWIHPWCMEIFSVHDDVGDDDGSDDDVGNDYD